MAHVIEYAVLALLVSRALYGPDRAPQPVAVQTGVGCFIFGILDECYQSQVPERTFQIQDLGLDLLGILLGAMLFMMIKFR